MEDRNDVWKFDTGSEFSTYYVYLCVYVLLMGMDCS